jgi:hypothetical protein
MPGLVRLLRTEPYLTAGAAQAVVALTVASGLHLTARQAGALEAATTAILGAVVAWNVRPLQVPALTGATAAVVTLLAAFGVPHTDAGTVSAVNATLVAVLTLFRGHVTPLENRRVAAVPAPAGPPPL